VIPDQIQSLLPPIVISIGAILPFLVASPPFAVSANARMLLICIMTLVIWLGYWTAYAFGSAPFASFTLTIILIAIALSLFLVIFFVAQQPSTQKRGPDGSAVKDADGNPVMYSAIDRPGWLWLYLVGLLAVSLAAAWYVGGRDWIVVEFELPKDGLSGKPDITVLESVKDGRPVSLDPIKKNPVRIMLTRAEFEATEKFQITTQKPVPSATPMTRQYDAFTKYKSERLIPSLSKQYRISVQQ